MAHAESGEARELAHKWAGRVIDRRYKIVKPLGEGAMGSVFVAEHLTLHKQVALKLVRAEYARNSELLARFAREALAGSKIEHPNVVAALDYGALEEGGAYLVMPLVPGECLADMFWRRKRLPWPEVAELGAQIADALAAAWARGFVHRDLKPENVLVEPRDGGAFLARVIDFGVAKLFDQLAGAGGAPSGGPALTKEGTIIGTPGYMAPEQALGRPATHTADLYSLGVILWEALVGKQRWEGDSVHAILRAQLKETRPSAREASGDESIPVALDQLVERLLSFRPEERPAEAREVRDQLRGIARQRGGAAPSAPKTLATAEALRSGWVLLVVMLAAGGALGGVLALAPLSSSDTGDKAERSAAASGLPAELEPALRALASGSAKARRTAADQLLHASEGAVPAYATQLARLELARSCKEKKPVLEALLALGDERAGPSLARLASEPERGCGPREKQDCLGCLRELLARATVPR
ncbi:MAG TPA: serine/threonine-protein kinase [Polyangiaceae bacterium]|nr:serine/threonine-protein kinase [Polyangiaceae bacterium]